MNILVIGSGGREHAIVWKLAQSSAVNKIYAYPGNAGTAMIAENLAEASADTDWKQLIETCRQYFIDWVFVGPEQPLSDGVVDALQAAGIPAFGPHAEAAQLEGSKQFSKEFMVRNNIPTAAAEKISTTDQLETFVDANPGMIVLKKSGLAAGKGVLESDQKDILMDFGRDILASDTIVAEEYLRGYEVSLFTLSNGKDYVLLPPCADYKKAGDGNTGPNTGGMGAICPVPWFDQAMLEQAEREIIAPTHAALVAEGLHYKGILYFGLMITQDGPKLLEYNVRFGDPEAQIVLPIMQTDLAVLCQDLLAGKTCKRLAEKKHDSVVTVVAAAPGYPGTYPKGLPVDISADPEKNGTVFHASTILNSEGALATNGGRCFTASGWGESTEKARAAAYEQIKRITFSGMWYRNDIGTRVSQSN